MAVLITGGAGYIGSHTCVELLGKGEEIIILDNFSNAKPDVLRRIHKITGKDVPVYMLDVLDKSGLDRVFSEHPINSVIHFAGKKAVGESVQVPLVYYQNNITGTLNLCAAMEKAGCKKLVFSSSATVYGLNPDVPFREDYPLSATNPYGWTKRMIEQILQDLFVSDPSWSISLLRYFNPIGAHESGLLGEDPCGIPNNLLPYISKVASGKLPHLNVFGDDYDTPDGTGVRDYLHVMDLARGHALALDYIRKHIGIEAVNLGTGRGYSVLEVLHAFETASGKTIPYQVAPRRAGDIATCYADPAKAKTLFGFETQRDLAQMCADTWRFICQNPNGIQ